MLAGLVGEASSQNKILHSPIKRHDQREKVTKPLVIRPELRPKDGAMQAPSPQVARKMLLLLLF